MAEPNDPAREAWALLWEVMQANKPRFMALAQELALSPVQLHTLRIIEPGIEVRRISYSQDPLSQNDYDATIVLFRLTRRFDY